MLLGKAVASAKRSWAAFLDRCQNRATHGQDLHAYGMSSPQAEHSPALVLLLGVVLNTFRRDQKKSASRPQDLRLLDLPYKQKFQKAAAKLPVAYMRRLPARAHIHARPDLPHSSHIEKVWKLGHEYAKPGTKKHAGL